MDSLLDQLVESDTHNYGESKRVLRAFHSSALSAAEHCLKVLEAIATAFGEVSGYDDYSNRLDDWLESQGGGVREKVRFLEQATLLGKVSGEDPVADAKEALGKAYSVVARTYLVMRLRRDCLFGLIELLRLRLTPALGYLRLQSESTAILALQNSDPVAAREWLDTSSTTGGKNFYNKHHRSIIQTLKSFDLHDYYEQGSYMSLHSRVFGVTPGIIIGSKDASPGTIALTYQEIDDAEDLILWFCVYLRAHERIIAKLPVGLPEVDFSRIELQEYSNMVESLWARLKPLYIRKRGPELETLLRQGT